MEKKRSQKKMKSSSGTTPLCIPRFRNRKNRRPSPMTLLERFREAVFRLIMLSALSKNSSSPDYAPPRKYYNPADDQYHSEAVADCIEFIKKKASTEENRDSTASSSTIDAAEMVLPVGAIYTLNELVLSPN